LINVGREKSNEGRKMLNAARKISNEGRKLLNAARKLSNEGRKLLNVGSGNQKRAAGGLFGVFWSLNLIFLSSNRAKIWNFPPDSKRKTRCFSSS